MQGCGMRVILSADRSRVDAESQHSTQCLSLAVQGGQYERILPLGQGRRGSKALEVGPTSQTERRGQRQRYPSFQEMLRRREVAVEDRGIAMRAGMALIDASTVERSAGVHQHVDELNLYTAISRDPGPAHQPQCIVELFR